MNALIDTTESSKIIQNVFREYEKIIVGQTEILEKMLVGILTGGHILLEGVPGLAKTSAIKTFSEITGLKFSRIQFTPDLLPADILGTQIYNQKMGSFSIKKGPLFANVILADEINRAPSKVQSALLESMQESQITIGEESFSLETPYIVLATQNPLEQEGTYPLPEAQVDRFMLKVLIEYPNREEEKQIIKRQSLGQTIKIEKLLNKQNIRKMKSEVELIYIDEKLINYIVEVVFASREPQKYGLEPSWISYGASPRASINLTKAAKAFAYIQGENFVKTEDIKSIAYDVLRHRIAVSYEAEAEGVTSENIIRMIFEKVETP